MSQNLGPAQPSVPPRSSSKRPAQKSITHTGSSRLALAVPIDRRTELLQLRRQWPLVGPRAE
eukprot:11194419-Lingulodinium_polyedra.AAC.1